MEDFTQQTEFYTSISGKIRNTKLHKTKTLWALFEVVSNAIHAIEEKKPNKGLIEVRLVRNGDPEALLKLPCVEDIPINSFIVTDNGIGFNNSNFRSFLTAESEYKIEKGAKGIGRFVCLKAFRNLTFDSIYKDGEVLHHRRFDLKPTGKGIFDYADDVISVVKSTATRIRLNIVNDEYIKACPKLVSEICERIIEHFLVYFLLNKCPYIKLIDANDKEYVLQDIYNSTFKKHITDVKFDVKEEHFRVHLLRLYDTNKGHRVHYCANEREVIEEGLSKLLPDLGRYITDSEEQKFTYQAYVTSKYLDKHVKTERTGFDFPDSVPESDSDFNDTITMAEIRYDLVECLEAELADYLNAIREKKLADYKEHIYDTAPQFKPIIKFKPEAIKKMQPGLTGNKLNIELYRIQSDLEIEVKELGEHVLGSDKDFRSTEDYKELYEEYIEKFNEVGKASLAQYIVHRKAVIELLDTFLGANEDDKFETEETIHKIFFPIKSVSDEVGYDQQNLWLIDERLSYHFYLSSDKALDDVEILDDVDSKDRLDLLIFNSSFAFVNDEAPYNSFVIVEFKRPEREDYSTKDAKKNPIDQVIEYIGKIRENKAKDRKGKYIQVDKDRTPFYAYIICDVNPKLLGVLSARDFKKTPDGQGYFYFHKEYNAYIEFMTYQKVLKDAKLKNRILFEKLGLPY